MKVPKFDHKQEPIEFDDRSNSEQRLLMLIGGINGKYKSDYHGMEKAQSIRFSSTNYPRVKALSDLSGNSINSVVNDLVEVAYGVIQQNADDASSQKLSDAVSSAWQEWIADYELKDAK